jgi:hypothetical protein
MEAAGATSLARNRDRNPVQSALWPTQTALLLNMILPYTRHYYSIINVVYRDVDVFGEKTVFL